VVGVNCLNQHGELMPLTIFKTIDNYGAMLNKLATINFFVLVLLLYFLSEQSQELKQTIENYSWEVPVLSFNIPFGYFLPCLVLAIFGRIIKLHDKISDIFRIRRWYDWTFILKPMMEATSAEVSKKIVIKNRGSIMFKVFYKYASSRDPHSIVDRHLIEMVMDQLSWYWILLETILYVFASVIVLFYLESFDQMLTLIYIGLALVVFAKIVQLSCAKYTKQEVSIIIEAASRKREIKEEFDALRT